MQNGQIKHFVINTCARTIDIAGTCITYCKGSLIQGDMTAVLTNVYAQVINTIVFYCNLSVLGIIQLCTIPYQTVVCLKLMSRFNRRLYCLSFNKGII